MTVTINEKPYYVAGVIRRETDKFSEKALPEQPLMFMSYSELSSIAGGGNAGGDEGAISTGEIGISCYELVMADPISDFAKNFATEKFASGSAVVVQNSTRYSFGSIFNMFVNFGDRSISDNGVIYPYWENAARISEVYVARQYVFIALLGIIPFICLGWLVVLLFIFIIRKIKQGWAFGKEAWSDRYARMEKIRDKREERKSRRGQPKQKKPKEKRPKKAKKAGGSPVDERHETEAAPEKEPVFDQSSIAMDVESILREMTEDTK